MMFRTVLGFVWIVGFLSTPQIIVGQSSQPGESNDFREVSFPTSDGGQVFGNLYGSGRHAIVLAHGAVFNKESWSEQSNHLMNLGFRVLAIDFRGYGKSKSGTHKNALHLDLLAAVRYLHEHGANRVSVIGGSMGAVRRPVPLWNQKTVRLTG